MPSSTLAPALARYLTISNVYLRTFGVQLYVEQLYVRFLCVVGNMSELDCQVVHWQVVDLQRVILYVPTAMVNADEVRLKISCGKQAMCLMNHIADNTMRIEICKLQTCVAKWS